MKKIYLVALQVDKLCCELEMHNALDVFTIASAYELVNGVPQPTTGAAKVDLFKQYGKISYKTVKSATLFHNKMGKNYHVQNSAWSKDELFNSMDQELHDKVWAKVKGFRFRDLDRTHCVLFNDKEDHFYYSKRTLHYQVALANIGVSDFDGESVSDYASFV